MKNFLKLSAAMAVCAASVLASAVAEPIAIINAELHVAGSADNPRTIENGSIVIDNGRIVSVGTNVGTPANATVIDAKGQPVTPGIFAAISGIGLEEISLNSEGTERSASGDFPISAALDAEDALNTDSSIIAISRAAGITRAYVSPLPGGKLFGGCGAVIDFTGSPDPVTKSCYAQSLTLGFSGTNRAGGTKTGLMSLLKVYLDEVLLYADDPSEYRYMAAASDLTHADLKALIPYVRGQKPFLVQVHSAPDIRRLIQVKEDYDLDIILLGAAEAWRVGPELADADIPVILNPMANLPRQFESMASTLENAARLEAAGVTVSFYDDDVHNVRLLPQLAGNAVANGMSHSGALAAITLNSAKMMGLEDQLGTLQAGKIADVVVWDGDPLEVTSRPVAVIINGKETSLENRQSILAKRYMDLSRGDKPHAYRGE
ncbi:amidohydrolase family protein [Parvularcula sp. IMCC14364]|uniref:amidohydrolase family protein n=1 Tax=Parvularcula sp. IMCC14364 TaxID=3067902 RepID=UPI002740493C|nr:amidohydrolase family protein [Parvularcula sp. IMCC14364]